MMLHFLALYVVVPICGMAFTVIAVPNFRKFLAVLEARHRDVWLRLDGPDLAGKGLALDKRLTASGFILRGAYIPLADAELTRLGNRQRFFIACLIGLLVLDAVVAFSTPPEPSPDIGSIGQAASP